MRFDILTIFPEIIESYINTGVIGRAKNLKQSLAIEVHNIRNYTKNIHHKVDDTPFGGGAGMILQIEPIYNTLNTIIEKYPETKKYDFDPVDNIPKMLAMIGYEIYNLKIIK